MWLMRETYVWKGSNEQDSTGFSPCYLCVLGVFVVVGLTVRVHHRDTKITEAAQRNSTVGLI
jgi:hypothetical protein